MKDTSHSKNFTYKLNTYCLYAPKRLNSLQMIYTDLGLLISKLTIDILIFKLNQNTKPKHHKKLEVSFVCSVLQIS